MEIREQRATGHKNAGAEIVVLHHFAKARPCQGELRLMRATDPIHPFPTPREQRIQRQDRVGYLGWQCIPDNLALSVGRRASIEEPSPDFKQSVADALIRYATNRRMQQRTHGLLTLGHFPPERVEAGHRASRLTSG